MRLSVGTHNLLDGKGTATPFADLLLFTEAIPYLVRQQIGKSHEVRSCPEQRDLTVAWRRTLPVEELGAHYFPVVTREEAEAGVTPHRGTWVLKLRLHDTRVKVLIGHRINAAFPPFKRGEDAFRAEEWTQHRTTDARIIIVAKRNGWEVIAGGDLNTPPDVAGYPHSLRLAEARKGLDRIATTGAIIGARNLSRVGSDHPRLKCEVIL